MKKIRTIHFLALSLIVMIAWNDSRAHVPPSAYLIQQMAKKRLNLKGLRVKTRITGTDGEIKEVGWYDSKSHVWKAKLFDSDDRVIHTYEKKLGGETSLALVVQLEHNFPSLAGALIGKGIPIRLESELLKLKTEEERIASEKTGIARAEGLVGWQIGFDDPSLWILKDEFVPLLLHTDGMFVRFEETKTQRDFPYARTITLYDGKSFVLRGEAMEVMVKPDMTDMKTMVVDPDSDAPNKLAEQWIRWVR